MDRTRSLRSSFALAVSLALVLTAVSPVAGAFAQDPPEDDHDTSVLVFSATAAFRHANIPTAVAAMEDLGAAHGFAVDTTEDPTQFTEENLANYDAVVWLSTTGSVLNSEQQAAFESYIQNDGGYVGIHAASDTHYDWAWYGGLVGAYFDGHPPGTQTADVWVTDQAHPSTDMLPAVWERHDEWYDFNVNPRGDVHVLATIDESSYEDQATPGPTMGHDHPIAWCQPYDGGRSWYTAGGHTHESFEEELFLEHIAGGVLWAAGEVDGDCGGTIWDNFEKNIIADDGVVAPMGINVAPDGRVFYSEKDGRLQIIDPDTGETTTAADLDVFDGNEDGLVGIAFDPDFEQNDRIFLFYTPAGADEVNRVSRFTMDGDTLDLGSEAVVLEYPSDRDVCCHTSGDIEFGPEGDLWIATGDDTTPFESQNYTPIDERPGHEGADAQRTSANSNDLRGKLLRITPTEDGSYTIPEGNLFEPGTDDTLPEIHSMGFRNPFKFSVDQTNGQVYLADYGPDNRNDNPDRGPQGRVTWHIIDPEDPANYGWPYCHANEAYVDWDFETLEPGEPFDCEGGPINDSPNNTGLEQTPPVKPATVWYGFSSQEPFPMLVGGAPMGGPRYEYDPDLDSAVKWPASFDGSVVFGEWGANDLFEFNLNDDASDVTQISEMLPDMTWVNPQDFAFGPHDGALYVVEWGRSFGGPSPNSRISRIDYHGVPDPEAPQVTADAEPRAGDVPLDVTFSGSATSPVDADIVSYAWDFDDDGAGADEADATHTYESPGTYRAELTATDSDGRTGSATVRIDVEGDEPPQIPPGDLECIGDVGDVILSSDFDDGTVQGWGSVAGEPIAASDAQSRSGDYSLLTTERGSSWMGPDRSLTDTISPGNAYQISAWLRLPEGAEPAELYGTGVATLEGTTSWHGLGGGTVTVTDEEWVYFEGVWANVPEFNTSSVKFEGTANADFYLDDFAVNEIEPGDTDIPPSDDFEGDELDGCRWDRVVRYDEDTIEMTGGQLLIETPEGDIYEGSEDEPENFILQTQPDGDWMVETRYTEELVSGYSQAGLMVYLDDDNYVKFDTVADINQEGVNRIELRSEVDGSIVNPQPTIDAPDNDGEWWLRLSKEGDSFSGAVSVDGENWTETDGSVENALAADIGGVGIFTLAVQDPSTTVAFDYFHVLESDDPDPDLTVDASLDPADPDGDNDWYVSPVTISLSSNDDDAVLQWRLAGDDAWTTWTEPVTVDTDGNYEVEYRAIIPGDDFEPVDPSTTEVAVGASPVFTPDEINVTQGDTILYNLVGGVHDVVTVDEDGTEIDASPLSGDWGTHEFVAAEAGLFYIYCTPHSDTGDPDPANWTGMVGTVTVEAADTGTPEVESEIGDVSFGLDQTPPETTASVDGTTEGDAFVDEATVTLDADDNLSGVAETHIREQGDTEFDVYDSPVTFTGEGSYSIEFRSADEAGNVEDWQAVDFTVGDEGPVAPPEGSPCDRAQGGSSFPDAPGSGHQRFIDCLYELGIVEGYGDGTFGPANDVTRGQLASFVVRSIELATGETMETGGSLFPDVGVNSTHGQAIYKLRNAGIIRGYEDGTFRPADSVSRDQTARYVVGALELVIGEPLPTSGASFPDVGAGSQYAVDIDQLVTAGVVSGFTDGTFGPREPVTRGQMTRFIGNSLEVMQDAGAYVGP